MQCLIFYLKYLLNKKLFYVIEIFCNNMSAKLFQPVSSRMILTPRRSLVVVSVMMLLLEKLRVRSEQRPPEVVLEIRNLRSLVDSGFGFVRLLGRALNRFFRFVFDDRIYRLSLKFNRRIRIFIQNLFLKVLSIHLLFWTKQKHSELQNHRAKFTQSFELLEAIIFKTKYFVIFC